MNQNIDIICVGEILIDCIANHEGNLATIDTFDKKLGGSATNVAVNCTKLGLTTILVATCGKDGFGSFINEELNNNNVSTEFLRHSVELPTSVIFISKTAATPEFIPYRQADSDIITDQMPNDLLSKAKIFHTTCFALSKNPAQSTILKLAQQAKSNGLLTSIDINYSNKIWPNRHEAQQIIKDYCATNALVKVSEDDCFRLFEETKSDEDIFDFFHNLGASSVCLTKGKKGVKLSEINDKVYKQNALTINNIEDATGAGDAFWSGFLFAKLNGNNPQDCLTIAQKTAAMKLQNIELTAHNI